MAFHLYTINELYSNADGTVQFIELAVGGFDGEYQWRDRTITVTQGATVHSFTFPTNLPSFETANTKVLIATQGFADLGLVTPDFIIPAGFLFTNGGTVNFANADSVIYTSLPTDGTLSINRAGVTAVNSPTNFSGVTGSIVGNVAPVPNVLTADQITGAGQAFSLALPETAFTDANGDTLSYTATLADGGALPSWLSFDAGTRTFSGTPGSGDVGAISLKVAVSDGLGGTASDSFNLDVISGHVIAGTSGDDKLAGTAQADRVDALAGNDTLAGGLGADTLLGGEGDDTYVVGSGDIVIELAGQGIDTLKSAASRTLAGTPDIENLVLIGTLAANGTGNDQANRLTGNTANNVLKGLIGNDTLLGGAGNDTLDGGTGDDSLNGGGGDDTFLVNSLGDTLSDGAGIDTVKATLDWTLTAGLEHLTLIGAAAFKGTGNELANRLTGNNLANTLSAGAGNDTLTGGAGNDTLDGGTGSDSLVGGLGNDTYVIDADDTINELAGTTEGIDTVKAGFSYVLGDSLEKLTLTGSGAIDGTGNAAANTLAGNGGANRLDGKEGKDVLTGGLGADTFVFSSPLGTDIDTIRDFKTNDVIALDSAVFDNLPTTGLVSGNFRAATVADDADDFLLYDTGSGALYYDADGSGGEAPVQFATVWNGTLHPTLSYGDFTVIS